MEEGPFFCFQPNHDFKLLVQETTFWYYEPDRDDGQ